MLVDRESHPFNRGKSIITLLFVINISSVLHIPKFLEFLHYSEARSISLHE